MFLRIEEAISTEVSKFCLSPPCPKRTHEVFGEKKSDTFHLEHDLKSEVILLLLSTALPFSLPFLFFLNMANYFVLKYSFLQSHM